MKCIECGRENDSVKLYMSSFKLCDKVNQEIFFAEFKKGLCKDCLRSNINSLKGELEFVQEENDLVKDGLIIRINQEVLK